MTTDFTISEVNGEKDPYPSDNTLSRLGYSIKEGSKAVARKVLFEQFTSEAYDGIPAADEMYASVFSARIRTTSCG